VSILIDNPPNTKPLKRLFVFVSRDAEGREGILAGTLPSLGLQPLIAGSELTLAVMKELAKLVEYRIPGKTIHLLEFCTSREIEDWR
jgi:hypothetical protein